MISYIINAVLWFILATIIVAGLTVGGVVAFGLIRMAML